MATTPRVREGRSHADRPLSSPHHPCGIDLCHDFNLSSPLRLLQRRVPFLKSVIAISLSRPLTSTPCVRVCDNQNADPLLSANLYSGTFRIEFGSRAIELQVEALHSDLNEVMEQGVREVMDSITQISDPDMAEKWKASMKGAAAGVFTFAPTS